MSSKSSKSSKKTTKKKSSTRRVSSTTVVLPTPRFTEAPLQMEETKISKREIAEYLVAEQEQKLEDEIEAINNRVGEMSNELHGTKAQLDLQKFVKELVKENFSEKIERAESLFSVEVNTNIGGQLQYAQFNEEFTDKYPDIVKYHNQRNQRGYYSNNNLQPNILQSASISVTPVQKPGAPRLKEGGQVVLSFDVSELPEVQKFNDQRLEIIRELIQGESLIQEKQKALQLLRKNSRRITSQIVKSELLKTEGGTKLLGEISSIVSGTLAISAPKNK